MPGLPALHSFLWSGSYLATDMKNQKPEKYYYIDYVKKIMMLQQCYLKKFCIHIKVILKISLQWGSKNSDAIVEGIKVQVDPCTRLNASFMAIRKICKATYLI